MERPRLGPGAGWRWGGGRRAWEGLYRASAGEPCGSPGPALGRRAAAGLSGFDTGGGPGGAGWSPATREGRRPERFLGRGRAAGAGSGGAAAGQAGVAARGQRT